MYLPKTELESRAEIQYEIYAKAINIEAKTMIDIATKQIIPAVIKYTTVLAGSINAVKAAGPIDVSVQMDLLEKCYGTSEGYEQCNEQTVQGQWQRFRRFRKAENVQCTAKMTVCKAMDRTSYTGG